MRSPTSPEENPTASVTPNVPWRVTEVRALENFRLRVSFVDGLQGEVEMESLIQSGNAGVFAALRDPQVFEQVYLDYGTVTWPGEIDLAPDAMYDAIKAEGCWRIS